jgi:hypothetical protein
MDGFLHIPTFLETTPSPRCRRELHPSNVSHVACSLNDFAGLLQGARQLEILARFAKGGERNKVAEEMLQVMAEVVADGQHHDAITGRDIAAL